MQAWRCPQKSPPDSQQSASDKVGTVQVQTAVKLVIELIFEADFEQSVYLLNRIHCGAFRPVAVRIWLKVCFEDRLDHQLDGGLHLVPDRGHGHIELH